MYAQLGNIIFEGLLSFDSFESKDSTSYAQHDLINAKPILKPTGNDLEELSISIRLRAEFINPELAVLGLKRSKDSYEILPLLKGNGRYLGDYIIIDITTTDVVAFADGTVIEATVALTLREYASADKLQQQQASARKLAFATGDKKPLNVAAKQVPTIPATATTDLTAISSHANVVDRKISEYENNVTQQQSIANTIERSLNKMADRLDSFQQKVQNLTIVDNVQDMISALANVKAQINSFEFPISSITDLKRNNRDLQSMLRTLSGTSTKLVNLVISRRA